MRFKLDENFGTRTQHIFRGAGHDVQTVREEALRGASDWHLYEVCCAEQRCLVTLDLDFADVTRFPPEKTSCDQDDPLFYTDEWVAISQGRTSLPSGTMGPE